MPNAFSRLVPWLSPVRAAPPAAVAASPAAPEAKASRTGSILAIESLRRPIWTPRDYAAFAREGYMQNAIVYRSVRMVAEAAASIPILLYEGADEIEQHPLLDLIARPAPHQTAADFFEAWYGYLLVAGNAYAEAVGARGEPHELHVLRPDRMKVIPGPEGWPEAYEYSVNGNSVRFDDDVVDGVRPILHLRQFHPTNDHYGMSPLEAAATAIDIHNTAAQWNKALLDNSARPSGALVYSGGEGRLTAEQFDRLRDELETGFQGARQAGRPLLLEGGLDWKALSLSPKDMDFIEAKNAAAREIALALGVPPMLLGIPGDNTFSNYQEAQRAFWRQTVLPLFNRTMKALSAWLSPAWNEDLDLRGDLDAIEALTVEREALWARLQGVSFLTDDEKRAAIGYGPMPMEAPAATADFTTAEAEEERFNPNWASQPRHPRGNGEDSGRWSDGGGGAGLVHLTGGRGGGRGGRGGYRGGRGQATMTEEEARTLPPEKNPAVRAGRSRAERFDDASADARATFHQLRKVDPDVKTPRRNYDSDDPSEESARYLQSWDQSAQSRMQELKDPNNTRSFVSSPDTPGDILNQKSRNGTLKGDLKSLEQKERPRAEWLVKLGNEVDVKTPNAKRGIEGRTHDWDINGVPYEFKISETKATDGTGISRSISQLIGDAAGQSANVLVDATKVNNINRSIAERAIGRAIRVDSDRVAPRLNSVTILIPDGQVTITKRIRK